jgi:hypothetical protein
LPPLVWVGKISYPLYLWHWSLASLLKLREPEKTPVWIAAFAAGASVLLAWFTYAVIERPIKKAGFRNVFLLLPLLGFAGVLGVLAQETKVFPYSARLGIEERLKAENAWQNFERRFDIDEGFVITHGQAKEKVVLIGDSNAIQYWPRAKKLIDEGADGARQAVFAVKGKCPPVVFAGSRVRPECSSFMRSSFALIDSPDVKAVVLASSWLRFFDSFGQGLTKESSAKNQIWKEVVASLETTIRESRRKGKEVYLVLNLPSSERFNSELIVRRRLWGSWKLDFSGMPRPAWDERKGYVSRVLREVGLRAGAEVIDPTVFLCNENSCPAIDEKGNLIYADEHHLSSAFARDHAKYLDRALLRPSEVR